MQVKSSPKKNLGVGTGAQKTVQVDCSEIRYQCTCTSLRRNRDQIRPCNKHQHQGAARHGGHGNIWGHSEKKLPKLEVRAFFRSAGKGRKLATSLRL